MRTSLLIMVAVSSGLGYWTIGALAGQVEVWQNQGGAILNQGLWQICLGLWALVGGLAALRVRQGLASNEATMLSTLPIASADRLRGLYGQIAADALWRSWAAIEYALATIGIEHPPGFTSLFIFRRCQRCGTINIVKEDVFECAVCETALSRV